MKLPWPAPLNPPLEQWAGRRVWVVGASTGIGRATAALLHSRGAQVLVSARNEAALNAFVAAHPGAQSLPIDVQREDEVARAAGLALQGGPLDLVLYCAGRYQPQRATAFDLPEMRRHQQVNYVGALNVIAAVLPALLGAGRGHLSLVASVAGYVGLPNSLAYGPTKAALINLGQTLYFDLRPKGVAVSVINPGFVQTPLTDHNEFPMPAMISPERAALYMLQGWARGRFEIHYPLRFTLVMKLLSILPFRLCQAVLRRATGL